jgi:predicted ester cyclase
MSAMNPPTMSAQLKAPTRSAQAPGSTPADHERTVRKLIERGFNEGDLDVLDEVLDPAFIEHESVAPGIPPTQEAVRAIIGGLRTGFPDLHLSIEAVDAVGDRVWLRIRATGTHEGPFMGRPPTGRKLAIDVLDVCRMRNGRIVEHWGVPDHLSAMDQLGLLPSDDAPATPSEK